MALLQPTGGRYSGSRKREKKGWEEYLAEALTGIATQGAGVGLQYLSTKSLQEQKDRLDTKRQMDVAEKEHGFRVEELKQEDAQATRLERLKQQQTVIKESVGVIKEHGDVYTDVNQLALTREQTNKRWSRAVQIAKERGSETVSWEDYTKSGNELGIEGDAAFQETVSRSGSVSRNEFRDWQRSFDQLMGSARLKQQSVRSRLDMLAGRAKTLGMENEAAKLELNYVEAAYNLSLSDEKISPIPVKNLSPRQIELMKRHGRRLLPADVAEHYEREFHKYGLTEGEIVKDEYGEDLLELRQPLKFGNEPLGSLKQVNPDENIDGELDGSKKAGEDLSSRTQSKINRLVTDVTPREVTQPLSPGPASSMKQIAGNVEVYKNALNAAVGGPVQLAQGFDDVRFPGRVGGPGSVMRGKEAEARFASGRTASGSPEQPKPIEPHQIQGQLWKALGLAEVRERAEIMNLKEGDKTSVPFSRALVITDPKGVEYLQEQFTTLGVDPQKVVNTLEQAVKAGTSYSGADLDSSELTRSILNRFYTNFNKRSFAINAAAERDVEAAQEMFYGLMTDAAAKELESRSIGYTALTQQTTALLDTKEASKYSINIALAESPSVPKAITTSGYIQEGLVGITDPKTGRVSHYKNKVIGPAINAANKEGTTREQQLAIARANIVKLAPKFLPTSGTTPTTRNRHKAVIRTENAILKNTEALMERNPKLSFQDAYGKAAGAKMEEVFTRFKVVDRAQTSIYETQDSGSYSEWQQDFSKKFDQLVGASRAKRIRNLMDQDQAFRERGEKLLQLAGVRALGIGDLAKDAQGRSVSPSVSDSASELDKIIARHISGKGKAYDKDVGDAIDALLTGKFSVDGGKTKLTLSEHVGNLSFSITAVELFDASYQAQYMRAYSDPYYAKRVYDYDLNNPTERQDFNNMSSFLGQAAHNSAIRHLQSILSKESDPNRVGLDELIIDAVQKHSSGPYQRGFYRGRNTARGWVVDTPLKPRF